MRIGTVGMRRARAPSCASPTTARSSPAARASSRATSDDEAATAATVDADGWLHTGDVGVLDGDGFLTITDRKKDIIITAGGKNISPSEIENQLKVSPYVREAVVIGDRRKYLVALVGIELDTVGDWAHAPWHRRSPPTATSSQSPRCASSSARASTRSTASSPRSRRSSASPCSPRSSTTEDGELTATQKVKRKAIEERFAPLIDELYGERIGSV